MQFTDVTYAGPPIDDAELLDLLPGELAGVLREVNGFVAFRGGLHLRGACRAPAWHSLRAAWLGPERLVALYPALQTDDIPFAQDALGDQFVLRGGVVHRLSGETGEVEGLRVTLTAFLAAANADPVQFLSLQPLLQFEREGERLAPGQLLSVYPPFCSAESAGGVSLRAIPVADRLGFLASLAAQLAGLPEGSAVRFKVVS